MNHKYVSLGIAAIIAALAVTSVGFAVPQQAFAHKHHYGINVEQDISQANICANDTQCVNEASNQADIDR